MNYKDTNYYNSEKYVEFKKDILENIDEHINVFYKYKIVNSKVYMAKILSENNYLSKIVKSLHDMKTLGRGFSYKREERRGIEDLQLIEKIHSNRREEIVCKLLATINREQFIDYQVPLKPSGKAEDKGYGKIDLLLKEGNDVRLIELKKFDSDENIARAMIEICTYYKQLNIDYFKKEYGIMGNIIPTIAVSEKMLKLFEQYGGIYKKLYVELKKEFGLEILKYTYNDQVGLQVDKQNMMTLDKNISVFPFEPYEVN